MLCCVFSSNEVIFTYSGMYSGKRGGKKTYLVNCNSRPRLGPAAALDVASGQILIDFRGICRIACSTTVSFPFWFPWTASAPLLGMRPRRRGDERGLGLCVASVAADGPHFAASKAPRNLGQQAFAQAFTALGCKTVPWRVLRPMDGEHV